MIKLYKSIDGALHYWETWEVGDGSAIIHWGVVGEKGQSEQIDGGSSESADGKIRNLVEQRLAEGYSEVHEGDLCTLLIEYAVDGMGTTEDIDKRHRLEDRMNETLGWTGLGHCDGGSIGSGTMEVCCFVVDFGTAESVIEKDLEGTEFENFTRIYDENDVEISST
jgi:hypothetical protein